jgi:hypothetical protein
VRVVVDGRRITDPARWAGAEVIVLGAPSTTVQRT